MSDSLPVPAPTTLGSVPSAPVPVEGLRSIVEPDMAIASVEIPRDAETAGALVFRGRLLHPSHEVFPRWLRALNAREYTPMLRPDEGGAPDDVILRIFAGVVHPGHSRVWINAVLFVLTVVSVLFVGSLEATSLIAQTPWDYLQPANLLKGLPFAATLLGILAAHEFGHYFAARHHRVAVTLPYFIPMPVIMFGTLGAFIRLKEPVTDRRKLFDIGVAGPLAGLAVALPLLFVGLATSPVVVSPPMPGLMIEGNSLLYWVAKWFVYGQTLPNPITGQDVMMNQVLSAAWFGLLVTAINLLPVGQLDGGHAVFALFGKRARILNLATVGALFIFALASLEPVQRLLPIAGSVGFSGWFLWLLLIIFVIGIEHPPALDDVTQLDRRRRWIGYLVIIVFIVTFVPVPMRLL